MSALSALKKASKKTLAEEIAPEPVATEPETTPVTEVSADETEGVVVDVDAMTAKELDALVKDNEIQVPDEWKKWKKDTKIEWLKANLQGVPEEEVEAEQVEAEEAAPEPVIAEPTVAVEEASAKPAKKGSISKKSTSVATSSIKHGEVMTPDKFSAAVSEIENMDADQALKIVYKLSDDSDFTMFKLGGVLARINEDGWYKKLGFASFREYIDNTQSVGYRTATYWTAIYRDLVNSTVPYDAVASVKWSKLKEIAKVINPDNVEDWVKKANENTIDTLKLLVANFKKGDVNQIAGQLSTPPDSVITTMQFKVHADQRENIEAAIEKAKADSGTDVQTVALEYICIAFNSNAVASKPGKQVSLQEQLEALGPEAAAQTLLDAFPNEKIDISIGEE